MPSISTPCSAGTLAAMIGIVFAPVLLLSMRTSASSQLFAQRASCWPVLCREKIHKIQTKIGDFVPGPAALGAVIAPSAALFLGS